MTPEDLLAGPRGRRMCFELRRSPDLTEEAIVKAFARSVDAARYWQEPEDKDYALADASARNVLLPVAAALCESPDVAWWGSPVQLDDLYVVAFDAAPAASITEVRSRLSAEFGRVRSTAMQVPPPHVDWRTCSGLWWSSPLIVQSARTTRTMGSFGPVELSFHEDSDGPVLANVRQVTATPAPRVYEIASANDWIALVSAYPLEVTNSKRGDWWRTTGRDGRWLMPDWLDVAGDYDAVHLTARAYLGCAGVPLDLDDGATLIAGWNPDATFWLADVLEFGGPPQRWRRDQDAWVWHRAD